MKARRASSLYQQLAVFSTGLHSFRSCCLWKESLNVRFSVLKDGAMIYEAFAPRAH